MYNENYRHKYYTNESTERAINGQWQPFHQFSIRIKFICEWYHMRNILLTYDSFWFSDVIFEISGDQADLAFSGLILSTFDSCAEDDPIHRFRNEKGLY